MVGRVIAAYVAGVVTRAVIGPVAKSSIKGTVKASFKLKQLTREATAEFQTLAAEASADLAKTPPPVPASATT